MGILFILVIIVVAGALAYSYYRRRGGKDLFPTKSDDALETARQRYANGEISREEFEQIKRDLEEETQ
jgi:uncharacterized membrane protein